MGSTFAFVPKSRNNLTCSICLDIITDLDNFITSDTTEDQIVAFAKEICHALGSLLGASLEAQCNALMESQVIITLIILPTVFFIITTGHHHLDHLTQRFL